MKVFGDIQHKKGPIGYVTFIVTKVSEFCSFVIVIHYELQLYKEWVGTNGSFFLSKFMTNLPDKASAQNI